jgi:ATP-dependent helicase/nuclease subunit B
MVSKITPKIDSITTAELDTICAENTLTITPNKRTCSNLTDRAVAYKMQDKKACKVPDIFDLDRWVRESFSDLRMANIAPFSRAAIISESAYAGYWVKEFSFDQSVCESLNVSDYLNPMIKADKVASRWKFGHDYPCDTPLSGRYKEWRLRVYEQLSKSGFVTINQAIEMLIEAVRTGKLSVPDNIAIYSFDEIPPLYQDLFNVLATKSQVLKVEVQSDKKAMWQKIGLKNKASQYETVARWALEYHTNNPGKRIAIVVPDMEANKKRIIRELDDLFKPQWSLDLQAYKLAYDVSLGDKLTSFSFVSDALFTLSINTELENIENISRLFRIPSIKHFNIERYSRYKYANKIMDNGAFEKPLSTIYMHQECPLQIRNRLSDFEEILQLAPMIQLPSEWAKTFSEALDALGWLRDAGTSEYISNGIDGFKECFDKLGGLDLHLGAIERVLAHKLLSSYCEFHTVGASVGDTPISIFGTLEAAGLQFDTYWVVDCNAEVFPSMVSLNDCLPITLQIEKEAPHSSVLREFEYTNRLFDRYKSSCSQMYSSYVLENEKSVKVNPAYVLQSVPEVPSINEIICDDLLSRKELHYQRFNVVSSLDVEPAPVKFSTDGLKTVKGGTGLVDSALRCSMGAYIKHELGFRELSSNRSIGYTSKERGDIFHEALEFFWIEIKKITMSQDFKNDHETLVGLTHENIFTLLDEGIETGLFWVARDDVPVMLRGSEKELIMRTLLQWIEIEKDRTPFNVVAIEMTKLVMLGDYAVKVRLDRIDEVILPNSHLAVAIDYKSGENDINQALARKFSSQLPLASLLSISNSTSAKERPVFDGSIDAVGYANIRLNNASISGIGQGDDLIGLGIADASKHRSRSAPKGWDKLKIHWKENMIDSISNYASGKLTYTPSKQACEYCPNKNYCDYSA